MKTVLIQRTCRFVFFISYRFYLEMWTYLPIYSDEITGYLYLIIFIFISFFFSTFAILTCGFGVRRVCIFSLKTASMYIAKMNQSPNNLFLFQKSRRSKSVGEGKIRQTALWGAKGGGGEKQQPSRDQTHLLKQHVHILTHKFRKLLRLSVRYIRTALQAFLRRLTEHWEVMPKAVVREMLLACLPKRSFSTQPLYCFRPFVLQFWLLLTFGGKRDTCLVITGFIFDSLVWFWEKCEGEGWGHPIIHRLAVTVKKVRMKWKFRGK